MPPAKREVDFHKIFAGFRFLPTDVRPGPAPRASVGLRKLDQLRESIQDQLFTPRATSGPLATLPSGPVGIILMGLFSRMKIRRSFNNFFFD